MSHHNVTLAALIGSRICHDLISPIGAVSNGLELIEMSGDTGPEMALVADSAANANARIRLFRIAFGISSGEQAIAGNEISAILAAAYPDRIRLEWAANGSLPRQLAQAVLLGVLCVEQAIPYGGQITVSNTDARWEIRADAERMNLDAGLWSKLQNDTGTAQASPSEVQFLLLPRHLAEMGRQCEVTTARSKITLTL